MITIPVQIISKATTQTIIHGTRILTKETGTKNQIGVVNKIMVKIIGTINRNFSRIKTNRLRIDADLERLLQLDFSLIVPRKK